MKKNNANLDWALRYLKAGWSVIPVGVDKRPIIKSWMAYQKKRATQKEVKEWWGKNPEAGIAVVCGEISGIIVVDIDPKSGGTPGSVHLPPTLVSNTGGGGWHYFYKWRKGLIGAKVGVEDGIDIRSDASYIILPPSLHKSGNNYAWANEGEGLEEAPEWMEDKNYRETKEKPDWDKLAKEGAGKGTRNMTATQFAGKILYETSPELWDTMGWEYFKMWNKENDPPLNEKELATTWKSVKKTHIKNNPGVDRREKTEEEQELEEVEEEAIVKTFIKNKARGTYLIAQHLTNKFNIITIGEKEREMYVYRDGMYFQAENEIIFPEIQRILKDNVTKNAKTETFHKIADMTSFPRDIFASAPIHLIPLKNGVYDRINDVLLPHDPKYRFTYQFPVIYNKDAKCPNTEAFLDQVLTPDQKATVEEWMGYYFHRLYSFKKAIIFVGEGDTGKTTLLETITHMLGRDNISSVSLQKMTGDKFAAAHLYEKHGNLVDELSAKDVVDTGNFKIATGNGSISGEYKFGNQFSFSNFSKFTFACNKIPDVKDFDDEAYFNRWMVMRFEKTITKKIPNFISTLTTEEERSGLFNLAMVGLRRLLEQEKFTYAKSAVDTKLEMMRSGSSIATFVAESVTQETGSEMTKEDMYEAYTSYCAQNALAAETMKMFGTKFLFYVSYASEGLVNDYKNGRQVRQRGWRNVALIKSPEQKEADDADKKANDSFVESLVGEMPTVEEMTSTPIEDDDD